MSGLTSFSSDREKLKIMTMEYMVEEEGHRVPEPIVQLFCRDADGNRRYLEVKGFYAYFYISEEEYMEKEDDIVNERKVRSIEVRRDIVGNDHVMNNTLEKKDDAPATTLHDENLVKIYTVRPEDVKDLREIMDETWEADVFFTNRFLISNGIKRGIIAPSGEDRVDIDDIEATENLPDVEPRMLTIDIEVWTGGSFPDTEHARKPITAYTLHDSYTDTYKAAILSPEGADKADDETWTSVDDWELPENIDESQVEIDVYNSEGIMLDDANQWIIEKDPDLMTGWNCLPEGTPVQMADGSTKAIDSITEGDNIIGIDGDTTEQATVTDTHSTQKEKYTVTTSNGEIESSNEHRFLTVDNNGELTYTRLKNLSEGDMIVRPKEHNVDEHVPTLEELVPIENQRYTDSDAIRSWRHSLDNGYRKRASNMFNISEVYAGKDDAWTPKRVTEFGGSVNSETEYRRTGVTLSREITETECYLAGLVASDGTMSTDYGIRFYNTERKLHDQFPGDNKYTEDTTGCYKQNVLDYATMHAFNALGIPFGNKNDTGMNLSTVYSMPVSYIQQFIAGIIDGDGTVSDGAVYISAKSDDTARWYARLLSRCGITSSSTQKGIYIHKSQTNFERLQAILDKMALDRKVSAVSSIDSWDSKYEKVPESCFESSSKKEAESKYNGTFMRHNSNTETYDMLQFVEIESIESGDVVDMYDISTTSNSFIANGFAVHNSSRNDIGNGFDYPYWLSRCETINVWSFRDLSPLNQAFTTRSGTPRIKGREMFDMLQAYKKTQIHEKRSYSLEYIANEELGYGKEDIDSLDDGWLYDPVNFMKYNIRDVEAVVGIEKSKGVLDMYDHIRHVTGTSYSECADSNIGIIDGLFLRQAYKKDFALPTSTVPERGWYYGGKVFNPTPGKHENVLYPDLASLYPYLMWSLNVSPETCFDSLDDASAAGYSEDQLYRAFVDRRDDDVKKESDPEHSPIYFTKPDVKEGFVREVVTDMTDMKYEYKKDDYSDEKYDAVKRIVNSLYGVFGDSASYGKGFRLFDWRLAESVTLAGQDVLTFTSEQFVDHLHTLGYDDAKQIGGDTDSVMTKIPSIDVTPEEIQEDFLRMEAGEEPELPFFKAAQYVNASYDEYMKERFWIADPEMHKMEVEIESYADSIFFLRDFDSNDPSKGVKKRYSQLITWDEGDIIEEPEPATKGFELVRSDTASITAEVQEGVLHRVLREDEPHDSVEEYLKEHYDASTCGKVPLDDIGIPSSIGNPIGDYGWSVRTVEKDERIVTTDGDELDRGDEYVKYYTAQPHIRGARYANAYIDGENLSSGDKPMKFYADGVTMNGEYPEVFDYDDVCSLNAPDLPDANEREMKEIGERVDCVSVNDVANLPKQVRIDFEKMAEKTVRDPIEPIVRTMGWDFDDLISDTDQSNLAAFM